MLYLYCPYFIKAIYFYCYKSSDYTIYIYCPVMKKMMTSLYTYGYVKIEKSAY